MHTNRHSELNRGRTAAGAWLLRPVAVLAMALLLSGCVGWAEHYDGPRRNAITGRATVQIGGHEFPLSGAGVVVSGVHSGSTSTLRDGSYSYSRMAPGRHKVTLRTLHGTYEESLFIEEGEGRRYTLDWRVRPSNLNAEKFFYLSGLNNLYIDDWNRLQTIPGTLVRWEKPTVRVYFDEAGAPRGLPQGTVARYMSELRRWENYVGYNVSLVRTQNPDHADIVVYWVPEGFLGDHAGIARHVAFYANGALKRVEIEIDVVYANFPGLWEHEFAHAMGVDHVDDRSSVLYPYLLAGQRTTLSSSELAHVRLMYDIPSGQELAGTTRTTSAFAQAVPSGGVVSSDPLHPSDRAPSAPSNSSEDGSGRREHVLYVDEELMEQWRLEGEFSPKT